MKERETSHVKFVANALVGIVALELASTVQIELLIKAFIKHV